MGNRIVFPMKFTIFHSATRITRRYRKHTLILETCFETADGAVTLIDFMPIRGKNPDCVRIVFRFGSVV